MISCEREINSLRVLNWLNTKQWRNSHQSNHTNQIYTHSITASSTITPPHQNHTPLPSQQQTHHSQPSNQTERLNYHHTSTPTQYATPLSPLHPTPSTHFTHPPTHNRVCNNRFLPKSISYVNTSSSNSSANGNKGGWWSDFWKATVSSFLSISPSQIA